MALHLAFYRGRKKDNSDTTWYDRIVCFTTWSKYSHVEILYHFNDTLKVGYSWGSSPRDNGVRMAQFYYNPQHWDIFELQSPKTEIDMNSFFSQELGCKYDWLGVLRFVIPFLPESKTRWFCSEIVASFLGFKKPWLYTPADLVEELAGKLTKVVFDQEVEDSRFI